MEISNELKDNLIADVENILAINISDENSELLKRCFEITIGHAISTRPVQQPERKMAEEILEKHFPLVIADKDEWAIEVLKCMSEYAAQGIDWPSEEESNKILDKKAFRVPYDGSDNFYDESFIKGWKACYEWLLNRVKK